MTPNPTSRDELIGQLEHRVLRHWKDDEPIIRNIKTGAYLRKTIMLIQEKQMEHELMARELQWLAYMVMDMASADFSGENI